MPANLLGYCTNVHPGGTLAEVKAQLDEHAVAVKQRFSPNEPMPIGLWFCADAARELLTDDALPNFRDFLKDRGLRPYTLNAFPYLHFQQPVVKRAVYQPDWAEPARVSYTKDCIAILAALLPEDAREGSLSTLPLGWEITNPEGAAENLMDLVHHLARVELDTGKLIHLDIEPEPGCVLGTHEETGVFFEQHLLGTPDDQSVLAYLRVCYDTCHAAVMHESADEVLERYRSLGVRIGKVQLSSAVQGEFDAEGGEAEAMREALGRFVEPRFLHQTTVKVGANVVLFEDLPEALGWMDGEPTAGRRGLRGDEGGGGGDWRVHFHVPIHLEQMGPLGTTQRHIAELLAALRPTDEVRHFEVETYAWPVLPELPGGLRLDEGGLAEGIAAELAWARERLGPG